MLLEFRFSNFRSILDEQVLNLVATGDTTMLAENCAPTGLGGLPQAVRSLAIYGPNASGKSNLVRALAFFQGMVQRSAQAMTEGDPLPVEPFLFVPDPAANPTEMEITFVDGGARHQYGFRLDHERIREEWLVVYRSRKPQQWFERRYDEAQGADEYTFGSHLGGERKLWQRSTRSNALFLSTAVQLNSEQLRPVFRWITERLTILSRTSPRSTTELLEHPSAKAAVLELLNEADLGIQDASVRRIPMPEAVVQQLESLIPAEMRDGWKPETREVKLEHEALHASGERIRGSLPLEDESLGTWRMFSLAAPLLEALEKGEVLVIDELDRSLHPLLSRFLVSRFHARQQSDATAAQLVFTTHTTSLLDPKLLRRDQVVLVEKGRNLASTFYPLTDFHARKGAPLEKSYLEGRMGAVPVL